MRTEPFLMMLGFLVSLSILFHPAYAIQPEAYSPPGIRYEISPIVSVIPTLPNNNTMLTEFIVEPGDEFDFFVRLNNRGAGGIYICSPGLVVYDPAVYVGYSTFYHEDFPYKMIEVAPDYEDWKGYTFFKTEVDESYYLGTFHVKVPSYLPNGVYPIEISLVYRWYFDCGTEEVTRSYYGSQSQPLEIVVVNGTSPFEPDSTPYAECDSCCPQLSCPEDTTPYSSCDSCCPEDITPYLNCDSCCPESPSSGNVQEQPKQTTLGNIWTSIVNFFRNVFGG